MGGEVGRDSKPCFAIKNHFKEEIVPEKCQKLRESRGGNILGGKTNTNTYVIIIRPDRGSANLVAL